MSAGAAETLTSHGGILIPLDMFRPTVLASVIGEALVSKARDVLDAQLRIARHPRAQLLLLQIEGSVLDDEPGAFWRENADLALILSQVVPRQLFLYYVIPTPERREGFIVAQRGQALAADDATADQMPADVPESEWPVAKLCQQIGIGMQELAQGFADGPAVEVALIDPAGDDREMLETLLGDLLGGPPEAGQPGEAAPLGGETNAPGPAPGDAAGPGSAATPGAPRRPSARDLAAEDAKRRAAEHQAEADARAKLALSVRSDLPTVRDELGIVVSPNAELSDTDILAPFVVQKIRGHLPEGLPGEWAEELQGSRIDVIVPVEFLSEVFWNDGEQNHALNKARFEEAAVARELEGHSVRILEVHAPRLSRGTLVRQASGGKGVFISRTPDLSLPEAFIVERLAALP